MGNHVRVARVSEIPAGSGRAVEAEGRPIALFNVGGLFHAVDGLCPHRGGPLGEGFLDGNIVTCPWHFWRFDVAQGRSPDVPEASLRKYPVRVEGDDILVEISTMAEPGTNAPGFSLPLTAGGVLRFPAEPARPALLAFFKDDCPTCRFTFPLLQRLHEQMGGAALVAGISQDDPGRARAWAADLGLAFPIAVDAPDYPVSRRYGLRAVPTLCLVDAVGRILAVEEGFRKEALASLGARLASMAGAPPPSLYREGESIPALKPG